MIDINDKTHTAIVIGSIDKIYKQSKVTGILYSNDIYILDSIYKLLSGCSTSITHMQRRSLMTLYNTILNTSKYTCKSIILDQVTLKSKFTQAEYDDCNVIANSQKIYYWQELNTTVVKSTILTNVNEIGYIQTKTSDTIGAFNKGKTISYTNIGLISFAITNTSATDNYRIYDILNNDVTESFTRDYLTNKIVLFVSKNIYSYGELFIKITKSITPLVIESPT